MCNRRARPDKRPPGSPPRPPPSTPRLPPSQATEPTTCRPGALSPRPSPVRAVPWIILSDSNGNIELHTKPADFLLCLLRDGTDQRRDRWLIETDRPLPSRQPFVSECSLLRREATGPRSALSRVNISPRPFPLPPRRCSIGIRSQQIVRLPRGSPRVFLHLRTVLFRPGTEQGWDYGTGEGPAVVGGQV